MTNVKIGFKAFDPHELLCHFVATNAGLYQRENITVELVDITFVADADLPHDVSQVSCGAALSSALSGTPQKIVFIATDKPMFWIYSNPKIPDISGLVNSKIATFPVMAPPHHLANIFLKRMGINVDQQVTLLPARDDVARFGLLASNHVDAAVISSSIAPEKIHQAGMRKLCFLGDEIRIPTSGLAVHPAYFEKEEKLVWTLVRILRQSLSIIHHDVAVTGEVLHKYFAVDDQFKEKTAKLFQGCFTRDGCTTPTIAQNAIDAMCRSLGTATNPAWDEIYTVQSPK